MNYTGLLMNFLAYFSTAGGCGLAVVIVWYGVTKLFPSKAAAVAQGAGIVHAAILAVHASGLAPHQPGWLEAAEEAFETQYTKANGQAPTTQDIALGVQQMASVFAPQLGAMAMNALMSQAPTPAVGTGVATSGTPNGTVGFKPAK